MTRFLLFFAILMKGFCAFAQPSIAWQRCYGGTGTDYFTDAMVTLDNGIITCITTRSFDGDLEGLDSAFGWVIKFDSLLEIEWQQFYGKPGLDLKPTFVKQLSDSSYVFYGFGGIGTDGYQGQIDFMLMKTDKLGNLLWHKSYGGPGLEYIDEFIATSDGGFLFTGQSTQAGGDIPFHYGDIFSPDANIIKTDAEGNIEWLKNLGGTGIDACIGSPVETSPGVYLVHIYSTSDDNDLADNGIDAFQKRWVISLNSSGAIINEAFYEAEEHLSYSDGQTGIISGNRTITIGSSEASSTLFPAPEGHLGEEGAIGIFSADLELTDVKMFGGSGGYDRFYRYFIDNSNNYYFIGISSSMDYDLPDNYNSGEVDDYWILKTDSGFNKIWSRNFGGSYESGELSGVGWDGDFVLFNNQIICFLPSVPQGELPDFDIQCGFIPDPPPPFMKRDAWMVAFDLPTNINEPQITQQEFTIFPNPNNGNFQIQFNLNSIETLFYVYNLNGECVYSTQLHGKNTYDIDLFQLPNGIYYVSMIGNDLVYKTQLLIIQK